MADIFGRESDYGQANFVTSDKMLLRVGTQGVLKREYLVQQVAIQFNQPLNRIYEVGSGFIYFAPGRPIGTMQISRIIGAHPITELLGPTGQGVWSTDGSPQDKVVTFFKKREDTGSYHLSYIITGAIAESYSMSADANGLLLQENVSIQFAGLGFGKNDGRSDNNQSR